MYMLAFPGMVDIHVEDKFKEIIRKDKVRNLVFDTLTVGVNVTSLSTYNEIAKVISETENPKTITLGEVIKQTGCYLDNSGTLV